jgi:hypothetical protein
MDWCTKTQGDVRGFSVFRQDRSEGRTCGFGAWRLQGRWVPIDPETRDVIETVYIRRVEAVNGQLVNVEFDKIKNVKDPIKARMPK